MEVDAVGALLAASAKFPLLGPIKGAILAAKPLESGREKTSDSTSGLTTRPGCCPPQACLVCRQNSFIREKAMDDYREENQHPEQSLQERGEAEGPDELEAARAEREGHAWLEEYLASLPPGPIPSRAVARVSERAIQLIVYFEVTDEATYRRKYQRPVWPGLNSGVTIGIGYDVGYTDSCAAPCRLAGTDPRPNDPR
jgi:hypothetical protein